MKKYFAIACLYLVSSSVMAAMYTYQPIGSSTVLGSYGNRHALSTAMGNPAAPYLMANLQGFRIGFVGPIGIGVEGGGVGTINDKVDSLEASVDTDYLSSLDLQAIENGATTVYNNTAGSNADKEAAANAYIVQEINAAVDTIEDSLSDVSDDVAAIADTTYLKFATTVQGPFLPIIYKTRRRGVFMIDASASLVGRAQILSDSFSLNGLDDLRNISDENDLQNVDLAAIELETDTSLYLKRVSNYKFSIGYSEMYSRTTGSALLLGGRLNFHKLAMDQKLTVLNEDGDSDVSYGDFFISREDRSDGISLDLGAIIAARYLQLGATLSNVNEPEFDYKVIGRCTGLSGADLSACNAAIGFADSGKISLKEKYKMKAQLNLSMALKSKDQNFSIAGSFDANSIKDPLGDQYQWAAVSISHYSDDFFSIGMRAGVRKNMAGNEMSYYTAGLTLSRRLDIDVAYSPENDDGDTGFYFSIGYSFMY
ncbi:conjugal transfer protein TraF [Marinomonas sp. TW1]|uniref:conjugal transfer protein TraF n=1 Tax=Marinomonas sp. TW1 TaxID=1561203 RepID=UPI0007AFB28F|nr:conjugal transfer protein TraF [Marinomonas sp. TW1]KZN13424.1 hypothetical protein OA79_10305 [Marinomonas sp. TW1]